MRGFSGNIAKTLRLFLEKNLLKGLISIRGSFYLMIREHEGFDDYKGV